MAAPITIGLVLAVVLARLVALLLFELPQPAATSTLRAANTPAATRVLTADIWSSSSYGLSGLRPAPRVRPAGRPSVAKPAERLRDCRLPPGRAGSPRARRSPGS